MMTDTSQSMISSFYQPSEVGLNLLRRSALFAYNAFVLANYDKQHHQNYAKEQLKVDWERQLLVDTSTYDISNLVTQYSGGWLESLTNLDKTTLIIDSLCKNAFENADAFGNYLRQTKERPPYLIETFRKTSLKALFIFAGLARMYQTYQKRYQNEENQGFQNLSLLKTVTDQWSQQITNLYTEVFQIDDFIYSDRDHFISWTEKGMTKLMTLNEMNIIWCKDGQYYESLFKLSTYDIKETADYSKYQIKACIGTDLLVHTDTYWSVSNWFGNLSSLEKTVVVIKRHVERAKRDCEGAHLVTGNFSPIVKAKLFDLIENIVERVIPGLKRMEKTYSKHYENKPNHPGLKELKTLIQNLDWAKTPPEDSSEELRGSPLL